MKQVGLIVLFLCSAVVWANPISPYFFSELAFTEDSWTLELVDFLGYFQESPEMDSIKLTSSTSEIVVHNLLLSSSAVTMIYSDSLASEFSLNPLGDTLTIFYECYQNDWGWGEEIRFGNVDRSMGMAPAIGQSLKPFNVSLDTGTNHYLALENTPDLGELNATISTHGNLSCNLLDAAGNPLTEGTIYILTSHGSVFYVENGYFALDSIECTYYTMDIMIENERIARQAIAVWPDSTSHYVVQASWAAAENATPTLSRTSFALRNTPNPFNPDTRITYSIPESHSFSQGAIKIYNVKGERVRVLPIDLQSRSVVWDGLNQQREPQASGVYFYSLILDGQEVCTQKMTLLK